MGGSGVQDCKNVKQSVSSNHFVILDKLDCSDISVMNAAYEGGSRQ